MGVGMVNRGKGFSPGHLYTKLFFQFPFQAVFGRFSWFDLSPREFPFAS